MMAVMAVAVTVGVEGADAAQRQRRRIDDYVTAEG